MEKLGDYSLKLGLGEEMTAFRQRVERDLLNSGAQAEAVADMIVALNEAMVNVVRHGYRRPGLVEVSLLRQAHALLIELRDDAPLFDPTQMPTPDISVPLEQRPFGGMGIHMMRAFLDELKYEQTGDGRNQLTLVKHNVFT